MKKILLANIGNRNITYNGMEISQYLKSDESRNNDSFNSFLKTNNIESASFYDFTQYLFENFEIEKENIQPKILNILLDEMHEEIEKLIIFSSDQKKGRKTQDTVFEGELLKKLFEQKYKTIEIECEPIRGSVVDQDSLLRFYMQYLKQLAKNNKEYSFIICDAGGTAYQKSALKICTEYLIDKEKYKVFYVAQAEENKSKLYEAEPVEYRKIIEKHQIEQLITVGQYRAAFLLHNNGEEKYKEKDNLCKFLKYTDLRIGNYFYDAKIFSNPGNYKERYRFDVLKDYNSEKPLGSNHELEDVLSKKFYFQTCEILSTAQFYLKNKNYTQAVLFSSIFIERFLQSLLEKQFGYLFISKYTRAAERFINEAPQRFSKIGELFEGEMKTVSVPAQCIAVQSIENKITYSICKDIEKLNSKFISSATGKKEGKGLDKLRNLIAHEGKGVSYDDLQEKAACFEEIFAGWCKIFALPEKNIYEIHNEKISVILADTV